MEKGMPMLSVIVTVYNTEKYVVQCLNSILNQSYKNIEIIVVDDCSPGNIKEIAHKYEEEFSNLHLISHVKNKGLFQARVTGVENCHGDFIAFVDSDDRIGCDFYRKVINKAIETDSDMVASEYILENETGELLKPDFDNLHYLNLDLKGKEIIDTLLKQEGLDYGWHVVWNKIYRKSLWDQCYSLIKTQTEQITMCEDVAFSVIFHTFASHYTNVHGDYYYYRQNNNSSTKMHSSSKRIAKNVKDIIVAFTFAETVLKSAGLWKEEEQHLLKWKELILSNWIDIINHSGLFIGTKKKLFDFIKNYSEKLPQFTSDEWFFQRYASPLPNQSMEKIKEKIFNDGYRYISFDIFDTLVVRPFWEPSDLFEILSDIMNKKLQTTDYVDFKTIRCEAEKAARKHLNWKTEQEVTLYDIYEEIRRNTALDAEILDSMKNEEEKLEIHYCYTRKAGKELFDFALAIGKSVIITSDMYLPLECVEKILEKNGYTGYKKLYLSSEVKLTKSTGALYKYILHDLKVSPGQILHIGDNWESDVKVPINIKMDAVHLPKTKDLMMNGDSTIFSGGYFRKMFGLNSGCRDVSAALYFLGIRCMLAVVSNKLYDDPFVCVDPQSDFSGNPFVIGYFGLGMYLLGISQWLDDNIRDQHFKAIHFMARDGYLPLKAYETLNGGKPNVKTDYLYLSRKAVLPLMIRNKNDFYALTKSMNVLAQSPNRFLTLFEKVIPENNLKDAKELCKDKGFSLNAPFRTYEAYYRFLNIFLENCYQPDAFDHYRAMMKKFLSEKFKGGDATFDIGYSCRIESVIKNNFGFDITPMYIHINNDIACIRKDKNGMRVETLYPFSPAVTGVVREHMISEMCPSCIGYEENSGEIKPVFEKDYHESYQTHFITSVLQNAALEFVSDMTEIFGEHMEHLYYRYDDACIPLEYILTFTSWRDHVLFETSYFEDDMGEGKSRFRMSEFWDKQTYGLYSPFGPNGGMNYYMLKNKWLKAIYLLLFDRRLLKKKVKGKYAGHPVRLKLMKTGYNAAKSVRKLFIKK